MLPVTMRAARFRGHGHIELVEKPVPAPGPGELLIQVRANALCGSERGQLAGGAAVTPGHELAGVVAAAGPATGVAIGTSGVAFLMLFCGTCRSCRLGHTNQCLDKRGDIGFNRDGGYGEYALVPESAFFAVDAGLPPDEATLLLDIMGTGGHAIGRARSARADIESLLITGAGPVGLGVLAMARLLLGPDVPALIADVSPYRLRLAEALGGAPLDLSLHELPAALRAHGVERVDAAIDTSGKAAARRGCVDALAQRGALVCVGHGEDLRLQVSPDLIASERAVLGSEYFRYDELPANAALLLSNRPYLRQIITHRYPLDAIQQAFEHFFAGTTGKVIIEQ